MDVKFSMADEWGYGFFKIAEKMFDVEYTNSFAYSKSSIAENSRKKSILAK